MRFGIALTASVVLFLAIGSQAVAQGPTPEAAQTPAGGPKAITKQKPKTETKEQTPAQPSAQASQPQAVMPNAEKIVLLLRNTLITLNDAIQTGNFTVLRDRGAPDFRDANSAARLSQAFSDLSSRGVDLSVVSVVAPQLTEAPTLDQERGMLHIKGYFPGQQVQINFEMLYQSIGGRWRLFGLSVNPSQPQPTASGKQP